MAAVAGGINQHIAAGGGDGAIQYRFQRLVLRLARIKAHIVAVDDEFFAAPFYPFHDFRQIDEIVFIDFNQTQTLRR